MKKQLIKKLIYSIIVLTLLTSSFNVSDIMAAKPNNDTANQSSYLIKFKDATKGKSNLGKKNKKAKKSYKHLSAVNVNLNATEVADLKTDPNIDYIELDHTVKKTADTVPDNFNQIQMEQATELGFYGNGVKVAVMDTGIKTDSSELLVKGGISLVPNDTSLNDVNGHGTFVAGIVAALKDDKGLIGVAPQVDLYAIKMLDQDGNGSYSQVIEGIEWAIDNKMDIVVMSFAGDNYSIAMAEAMDMAYEKGVLLVSASGNEGRSGISYPAKLNSVIAVGAVDENNVRASFSNTGNELEVVAPGVNIKGLTLNGTYTTKSGTSLVVPQVAGVAALIKGYNSKLTNKEIRKILNQSSISLGEPSEYGQGLLNAASALQLSKPSANISPNTDDIDVNNGGHKESIGLDNEFIIKDNLTIEDSKKKVTNLTKRKLSEINKVTESFIQKELDKGYSLEEIQKALFYNSKLNISYAKAITKVKPKFINKSKKTKSKITSEISVLDPEILNTFRVSAADVDTGTLNNVDVKPNDAPYKVGLGQETVSTLSGSLSRQEVDASLPGRNGLSFSLSRTYDSSSAQFYKEDYTSTSRQESTTSYYVSYNLEQKTISVTYSASGSYVRYVDWVFCSSGQPVSGLINEGNIPLSFGPFPTLEALSNAVANYTYPKPEAWSACGNNTKWRYVYGSGSITPSANTVESGLSSAGSSSSGYTNNYSDAYSYQQSINSSAGGYIGMSGNTKLYVSRNPAASIQSTVTGTHTVYDYSNTQTQPFEEKKFPIGKGWSWNVSYIQSENGKQYLHLGGSGVYEINGSILKGYQWKDLSFLADSSVNVNGEQSSNVLKSTSGMKQYFNNEGLLIQISDAYNNTIQFQYSPNSTYGKVLSSIVDAIGNTISITYSTTNVIITQGNKTITYNKTNPNGKELLSQVIDPLGRITTYDYSLKNAKFNRLGTNPVTDNPYALLIGITHPTGAKTVYQYEDQPITRYNSPASVTQAYRIKSREENIVNADNSVNAFTKKSLDYVGDLDSSYNTDYTFSTKIKDGLTENTFNYKKDYIDSDTGAVYYNTKLVSLAGNDQKTTDYIYDETRRLSTPNTITSHYKNLQSGATSQAVTISQVYDDYGNTKSTTNPLNITANYSYHDTTHLLQNSTQQLSATKTQYTDYQYNDKGSVIQVSVRESSATGTLMSKVDYGYDSYGNVITQTVKDDTKDIVTQFEFGSVYSNAFPTKLTQQVTDINGVSSTINSYAEYSKSTGELGKFTDGKSYITNYQYDKLGRLTGAEFPDHTTVSAYYDDANNKMEYTNETGMKATTKWNPLGWQVEAGIQEKGVYKIKSKQGYDTYGREKWVEDAEGNHTETFYDSWSRQISTLMPDGFSSTIQYDDVNKTQTSIDAEGNKFKSTADIMGRVWKKEEVKATVSNILQTLTYDYVGNILQSMDARNYMTSYDYDVLNRMTSVTNAKNEITQYQYDMLGRKKKIIYPDTKSIEKQYDERGLLLKQTDALGKVNKFFYDANGNRSKMIDKKGLNFSYQYSTRNLLLNKIAPNETIGFTYFNDGSRKSMTDATGTTNYLYDIDTGLLDRVTMPDGKKVQYDYYDTGKRSEMIDPFNNTLSYSYYSTGRINEVKSGTNVEASYQYYKNGALKQVTQGNGVATIYLYDGLKLDSLTHKKSNGTLLQSYSYDYDSNSNIINKTDNGVTSSFSYDALNRVETSSLNDEKYNYDQRGNRETTEGETPHEINLNQYEYDDWDRLKKVTTVDGHVSTFKYNGDNLLVEQTEDGTTTKYYYDGNSIIADGNESNGTTVLKTSYVRGLGLISQKDAGGIKSFYLMNGHGDVTGLTNGNGNQINEYTYDLWGKPVTATETVSNPFRYSGELWDKKTSLQYLRARWYDPSIGRFINEDTNEGDIKNPLSLNLYTYVHNNPLTNVDPSGHKCVSNDGKFTKNFGGCNGGVAGQEVFHDTAVSKYTPDPWNTTTDVTKFTENVIKSTTSTTSAKPLITIDGKLGVMFGAEVSILGVKVEISPVKRYSECDTTGMCAATMEHDIGIHLSNKVFLGVEASSSFDDKGNNVRKAFVGLYVGNTKIGWGEIPTSGDISLESSVGGVFGEITLNANLSEYLRRYSSQFGGLPDTFSPSSPGTVTFSVFGKK